jgi:hypothetical protein
MLVPVTAYPNRGLGADPGQTAFSLGTPLVGAGTTIGAAAATTGITSATLATAGITAGIGLVVAAVVLWMSRKGPKQNVITTGYVNQAEPILQQNLAAWNASGKSCAEQAACINLFQTVWNEVISACANPNLGDPGHSCLDDRLPSGVQFNTGPPANFNIVGNGRWDWFSYYLMPILNDPAAQGCCPGPVYYGPGAPVPMPTCIPSSAPTAAGPGGVTVGSAPINMSALLIPAAILAVLWAVS